MRALVVVGTADIKPQTVGDIRAHTLPVRQEPKYEIRKVEVLACHDVAQHRGLVDVHAHAHVIKVLRLLDVVGDSGGVVEFEHAEVDLDVASLRRDRQHGPVLAVKTDQFVEVQSR